MLVPARLRRPLAAGAVALACASGGLAQDVLHTFKGIQPHEVLGWSVGGAGDVNGDGYDDVIVGSPTDYTKPMLGQARVFSGKDGSLLHHFLGLDPSDGFGAAVAGAGDVDADGFDDLIVGAWVGTRTWPDPAPFGLGGPKSGKDFGSATVFSGKDGSVLHEFYGVGDASRFGDSVDGAGDLNGDGYDDVIVGSPSWRTPDWPGVGRAQVFSGKDGKVLYTFEGAGPLEVFGMSVAGAGDVNGDGRPDLIVGAGSGKDPNDVVSGSARVLSGQDGSLLHTFYGDAKYDNFGRSVDSAGDVDGDGLADLIVGANGGLNPALGFRTGYVRVFSGVDGAVLRTFYGDAKDDLFGTCVGSAQDVDGDGLDDLIVSVPNDDAAGTNAGSVRVYSGGDGSLLYRIDGQGPGDAFGASASAAGDVNADGRPDLVVGAPYDLVKKRGRAWVFSGCSPVGASYCGPANLNSTGLPAVIEACGSDLADRNFLRLDARQMPAGQFGYFLNSATQGFVPFAGGSQGNLCLAGSIGRHNDVVQDTGDEGRFAIKVDLTALPTPAGTHAVMAGETWNFQAWFRDANPGPTSNFTDGVSVTFM